MKNNQNLSVGFLLKREENRQLGQRYSLRTCARITSKDIEHYRLREAIRALRTGSQHP